MNVPQLGSIFTSDRYRNGFAIGSDVYDNRIRNGCAVPVVLAQRDIYVNRIWCHRS